jgi:energy-coupling factor transport system ATP-binding protein
MEERLGFSGSHRTSTGSSGQPGPEALEVGMTVEFVNVSFSYEPEARVLREVTFRVNAGEFLLIVGPNGAGKSTLLKLLNGILKADQGKVIVGGLDTAHALTSTLAAHVCVTFQNPADQLFASTVRREVEYSPLNLKRANARELTERALDMCELGKFSASHPYDLPPAQRKLLTIASAIASGSAFLAFDEPSAGLSQIEHRILNNVVANLRRERRGFLVVSHDLEVFLPHASAVMVLHAGRVSFYGSREDVLTNEGILRQVGLRLPTPMRLARLLA